MVVIKVSDHPYNALQNYNFIWKIERAKKSHTYIIKPIKPTAYNAIQKSWLEQKIMSQRHLP